MNDHDSCSLLQAPARRPSDDETLEAVMLLIRRLLGGNRAPDPIVLEAEPWLTPATAAAYAAVSEDTLRIWISSGQLAIGRVGKIIRIKRSSIDALLNSKKTAASGLIAPDTLQASDVDGATSATTRAIMSSLGQVRRKRNG